MVKDPSEEIIGVEYFVNAEDPLWQMSEEELEQLAFSELRSLGIYQGESRRESKVFRYKEAYPCYWGDFSRLEDFQKEIDVFDNLFSFGRQGLHRYINMDQAMMSALRVVDFLRFGGRKSDLWNDFAELHLPE
jgi:protoporphyrinogen oxidase